MFLCKECLTCGYDFHPSGSRGPCESCHHTTITADCHHDSSGAFESLTAEKKRLEEEKERKEDVVEHLPSRRGEFISEDDLIELARIPILEDEIGRLRRRLNEIMKFQEQRARRIWCNVCKLYHEPNATSWKHAVKKAELGEGYQNDEQTNTLCQVCDGLGADGKYSCESCNGSGVAGLMKWCENCHGYHDPNGPHPAGSAR